jgi:hypothetical protein
VIPPRNTTNSSLTIQRFSEILTSRLSRSQAFSDPETALTILERFETDTKLKFADPETSCSIKFGKEKDNDKPNGISRGRITFEGNEIKEAFDCCVPEIMHTLESQLTFRGLKSKVSLIYRLAISINSLRLVSRKRDTFSSFRI